MKKILFSKPQINTKDTLKSIKKILIKKYPNEGEVTKKFEKSLKKILKSKFAVSTTNGTSAIFIALKALNIGSKDEVIVPNITFAATANAVKMTGAKVVLVDIDPKTLLINIESLKNKISHKTKAVIPVHVSGRGSNIKKIIKICKEKNIYIVEDAAEAFGSKYKNKSLGTFGVCGCFSFAPNKIITTGQGGLVVTDNKSIFHKLKMFKDQGRFGPTTGGEDSYFSDGFNFKLTNLQSALGISQLKTLSRRKKKLLSIYKFYKNNLVQNKNFYLIGFDEKIGEIPLWTDVFCKKRNELFNYLKKNNIYCRYFWHPLSAIRTFKCSFSELKYSKNLQKKLMWLPSSLDLTNNEQKKICSLINNFLKNE